MKSYNYKQYKLNINPPPNDYLTPTEEQSIKDRLTKPTYIDYENDDPIYLAKLKIKPPEPTTEMDDMYLRQKTNRTTIHYKEKIIIQYYGNTFY